MQGGHPAVLLGVKLRDLAHRLLILGPPDAVVLEEGVDVVVVRVRVDDEPAAELRRSGGAVTELPGRHSRDVYRLG